MFCWLYFIPAFKKLKQEVLLDQCLHLVKWSQVGDRDVFTFEGLFGSLGCYSVID